MRFRKNLHYLPKTHVTWPFEHARHAHTNVNGCMGLHKLVVDDSWFLVTGWPVQREHDSEEKQGHVRVDNVSKGYAC